MQRTTSILGLEIGFTYSASMFSHDLDVFDGLALAASFVLLFMAWAFLAAKRRADMPGTGFLAASMLLGAWAWGGSATWSSFINKGNALASHAIGVGALLGTCCLITGFLLYVTRGRLAWKTALTVQLLLCALGFGYGFFIGPRWSADLVVSALVGACGAYCLARHVRNPGRGFLVVALAFFLQPVTLASAIVWGLDMGHARQLLGLPFALLGVMVFLVGFFRSHAQLSRQLQKIQESDGKLRDLVYVDSGTGLRTTHAQRERIGELIAAQTPFALLTLNMDDFRLVNDNLGPTGGNAIIAEAASVILAAVAGDGEVARSAGAEFSVLVVGEIGPQRLQAVGQRILGALTSPLSYNDVRIHLGLSIGIARCPVDTNELDELLRFANVAVHEAKKHGGRCIYQYELAMDELARQNLWLDHNLRAALDLLQFELHYQPKLLLASQRATSVEALLRWKHPERGNIRPDQFIPRAEATGLIIPIGRWVINAAAVQAAKWAEQGRPIRIAVNVSAKQLADSNLVDILKAAQTIAHGLLDIELTESCLAENEKETLSFIAQSRELGFGVHLDDFGTGYSSLARLGNLPLTMIKLDRAFITPIGKSEKSDALVRAMVSVGKELRLQIVAEGVETQEQADYLHGLGVGYAQGWLYAPAMASEKCGDWLTENANVADSGTGIPSVFMGLT